MIRSISLFILLLCTLIARGQQGAANLQEPEYRDQYTVLSDGRLLPLERETAIMETQSRRNFVITPSVSTFQTVRGPASPVRVPSIAHFYVKMSIGDRDPATVIILRKLMAGKADRRMPYMTIRGSLIPFAGPKHERAADDTMPFTVQKYGASSLEIIPNVPLTPGEYAFVAGNQAQCFGVDAGPARFGEDTSGHTQPQKSTQSVTASSAPPAAWRLQPIDKSKPNQETRTAVLAGTVEAQGKRYLAQLSMGCAVYHYTDSKELMGNLPVQLMLPLPTKNLLTGDFSCEGDGASGSPSVYTELGSEKISTRNACLDEDLQPSPPTPTISVGLTYEPALVKRIVDATGETLVVHIQTAPSGADNLLARFPLPQQATAVQSMLTPCIDLMTAARQKDLASIVVACPVMEHAVLSSVEVLTGPRMKALAPDGENDIGTAWDLRTRAKTNQPQPKRLLVCGYQGTGVPSGEKKTMPIPAAAKECVFRTDNYTNDPYGNCTR